MWFYIKDGNFPPEMKSVIVVDETLEIFNIAWLEDGAFYNNYCDKLDVYAWKEIGVEDLKK